MVRALRLLVVSGALALAAAACDRNATQTPSATRPSEVPTSQAPASAAPSYPPVYEPATPSDEPISDGYVGQTLTLDVEGTPLRVTFLSTALDSVAAIPDRPRTFSVWFSVENAGDEPWTGNLGSGALITDEFAGAVAPQSSPSSFSAAAERLGYRNRNLATELSIEPGARVDGVMVFELYGGNRDIELVLEPAGSEGPVTWLTKFGIF